MFENRLKFLLVLLAVPTVAMILRFVQLQVIRASDYRSETEGLLVQEERFFPCVRGDITDHEGRLLAFDAESWDIGVHYGILVEDYRYLAGLAKRLLEARGEWVTRHTIAEEIESIKQQIEPSWQALSELTDTPMADLQRQRERIIRQVQRVKQSVSDRHGVEVRVKEEGWVHTIVRGLDQEAQVEARIKLAAYPWIEVLASHTRKYAGGPAVGHFLGRMGEVSDEELDNDPYRDDELARYPVGALCGKSGVEKLGERWLRGRRGWEQKNGRGEDVAPPIAPRHGKTMRLTIDWRLQQDIYDELMKVIEQPHPVSRGACVVVLDVPSRQVLAMVSYPSVDPGASPAEWLQMAEEDPVGTPTLFRAVREYYAPGSIVKPMILAGAMADGKVSPDTRFFCAEVLEGHHAPNRCLGHHGDVDPVEAIRRSCNIFFYNVGHRLGLPRIAYWMDQFGLGQCSGTGLLEEKPGRLPSGSGRGAARNAVIGQGVLDVTPIQMANMAATLASGVYRPVTLWADDPDPHPGQRLNIPNAAWQTVRQGMYEVVNDKQGTAFGPDRATLEDADDYVLLGKTGSSQAHRRAYEWLFTCHMPNGQVTEVVRKYRDKTRVEQEFPNARVTGPRAYRRWPEGVEDPTHAWFIGYLARRDGYLKDCGGGGLNVAVAVVIEYGGHGGETASPVAKKAVQAVLHRQNGDDSDLPLASEGKR